MAARAALAVLSALVIAWFALSIRQSDRLAAAEHALDNPEQTVDIATATRARRALDDAARLNPDPRVGMQRARADFLAGERDRALRRLQALVDAHPRDIAAWTLLAFLAGPDDPLFPGARAAILRLSPPVPAP